MKYIINIPDDTSYVNIVKLSGGCVSKVKTVYIPELTPYSEPDEIKNNKVNLCTSCELYKEHFPECGDVNVLFGDGVGNDNICCCSGYVAKNEDKTRQKVEQEVWEFATMLMRMHPDVAEDIYWSMNGGKGIGVAAEMTYQEAKKAYNAWKNRNICVGDEVIYDSRTKAVVLIPETKERYGTILTDDFATIVVSHDELEKTGIHFDDIAELLKKMREE